MLNKIQNLKVKNVYKKTIAIFGKENTGKSTLFNKIMNISLSKTSPHLHTTRDSVNWDIQYKNQTLEFIDTAGFIRSRSNRKNLDFEKNENKFKFLYESKTPLFKKIETIAKEIYRADEVIADTKIRDQLKSFEEAGYGELPICVAKTQYSFSTDPNLKGAPTGHSLPIREIRLSSGAEFIVVVCGAIMTMPGLPRVPAADSIKLNKKGEIEGLF